jgi:hypothetical protein
MKLLYFYNIAVLLGYLSVTLIAFFGPLEQTAVWFNSPTILNVRLLLNIPILIFWILMLRHWSKGDKKLTDFLLLFFLIGLYTVFYYRKEFRTSAKVSEAGA